MVHQATKKGAAGGISNVLPGCYPDISWNFDFRPVVYLKTAAHQHELQQLQQLQQHLQ